MRIHKVVHHALQIHEIFCAFKTTKPSPHYFNAIFQASVIPFNCVIVVLQSVLSASNWNTRYYFGNAIEQFVKSCFIVCKAIANKSYQFSFLRRFDFFFPVPFKNLIVTRCFYLLKKCFTLCQSSFLDEKMRGYVLRNVINTV